ncbi:phosphatase PAP2 family protein [Mollicutes bacterium LVI A0039]|nr:phosphatase PAP2 family protein [Mollicutes bacterium LVI A0039]
MKKNYYWFIPIVGLMLIGTFADFQISTWQESINQNFVVNSYYRFFEIFGEFAFMLIFALVFGFFSNFGFRKENKVIKYIQSGLNGIGLVFFAIMEFMGFARYMFPEGGNSHGEITSLMSGICIFLGIILAIIIFKSMFKIADQDYLYYRKVAIFSIVYIVVVTLAVNVIKIIWARPRFWMVLSGEATFVPWYIINGNHVDNVTNAYMSFPSGHTANGFASLALSLWFVKKREKAFTIFMIWGLLTAISRIFASQHYLTDTVMGGLIAFTLFIIFLKIFKLEPADSH